MKKKRMKLRLDYLERKHEQDKEEKRTREAQWMKDLQTGAGEGYLILANGKITPVIISEIRISSPPAGYINVEATVFPQPPR